MNQVDHSPELTALERSVLETALLSMNGSEELRRQIDAARVTLRTPSGVGFVTKVSVPEGLGLKSGEPGIPTVIGEHPDLPSGAEFILQFKSGRLNSIEAYCFEGMWPSDESLFRVRRAP